MSHTIRSLKDNSLLRSQGYINGNWVNAKSGKTFEVVDPATGQEIGTMPEMNKDDVQEAINAAAAALLAFRKTTGRERARLLRRWYQLMMDNADDLTTLITWENGKSFVESRYEVDYSAQFFEWFSEEAPRAYGDVIPASLADHRVQTLKQPIGVCALITPWNWPAGMITRKVGPALAAGCTVVVKSPGETPLTAGALAVLAERAGIPSGVFNVVTAHKNTAEVGSALTLSPIIKKISFTGSTRVGKILMKQSADTLKKLSFELGGNAPFIIFDDADLEAAVPSAIASKFRSSGQVCIAANRIYVQKGIYESFTKALVAEVNKFKLGPGYVEGTTHGPLIHERAVAKVQEHIDDAVKRGGQIVAGGKRRPDLGPNFFEPTVIRDMKSDMLIAHDETFGLVAGLFPFETEAEIVGLANDTEVGLASYIWSRDISRCHRIAEALEFGMVGINTDLISDVAMPFGGVKESGFGREGSRYGMEEYMTTKSLNFGGMGKPLQT